MSFPSLHQWLAAAAFLSAATAGWASTSLGSDFGYDYHLVPGSISVQGSFASYKVIGTARREGSGEFEAVSVVNCQERTRGDYHTRTRSVDGWTAGTTNETPTMRQVFKGTRQEKELEIVCGFALASGATSGATSGAASTPSEGPVAPSTPSPVHAQPPARAAPGSSDVGTSGWSWADAEWPNDIRPDRLAHAVHENSAREDARTYYEAWAGGIYKQFTFAWHPGHAYSPTVRPVVAIVVDREGALRDVSTLRSSGNRKFDDALLWVIRNGTKAPRPPASLIGSATQLEIIAPIEYRIRRDDAAKEEVARIRVGLNVAAWRKFHESLVQAVEAAVPVGVYDCEFDLSFDVADGRITGWRLDPNSVKRVDKSVVDGLLKNAFKALDTPTFTAPTRPPRITFTRPVTVAP